MSGTRVICLTHGVYALVDAEYFRVLNARRWYAGRRHEKFYATRKMRGKPHEDLHYTVWFMSGGEVPDGMVLDHINGNSLDDRVENLRVCTVRQNVWNTQAAEGKVSRFKGVTLDKKRGLWRARSAIGSGDGRSVFLGRFEDEEAAAAAYDLWVVGNGGEYCWLNFPDRREEYKLELENECRRTGR